MWFDELSAAAEQVRHAGCVCGRVRLRIRGEPQRVGLCHCQSCRQWLGAPFSAFAVFRCEQVSLLDGYGNGSTDNPVGEFGGRVGVRRYFCRMCGSRVLARSHDGGEVEIQLGSFDETDLWRPDFEHGAAQRAQWLGGPLVAEGAAPGRRVCIAGTG